MRTLWVWLLTLCILLVGTAWYLDACSRALARGDDADVCRQWIVCRYTLERRNPWELAHDVLKGLYPDRVVSLQEIPRQPPDSFRERLLPPFGTPEAVYPPSVVALGTLTLGWIDTGSTVVFLWCVLNGLLILLVPTLLQRWVQQSRAPSRRIEWFWLMTLVLLFSSFHKCIASAQFSIVTFVGLLYGLHPRHNDWLCGLALSVALVKPSVAVPFLFIPLFAGRWRPLLVVVLVHGALHLGVCLWLGTDPLAPVRHWLSISPYLMAGMYSIQEVTTGLGWGGNWKASAVSAVLLLAVGGGCWLGRRQAAFRQLAFVGIAGMLIMHHGSYDFVCVLPALLLLLGWRPLDDEPVQPVPNWYLPLGLALFVCISVAIVPAIYQGDDTVTRLLRWAGRVAILTLGVVSTLDLIPRRSVPRLVGATE